MEIQSIYKLFLECNAVCTDSRTICKNDIFFALKGENFNGNEYALKAIKNGAKYAIIDEKKFENEQTILVDDVLKTLQSVATFHRKKLAIPIIAITGSNGKTTTKELISSVLSKKYNISSTSGNFNNHIGVPLTLLAMTKNTEIGIVEMGANHQKEIEFLCKIALPDYGYITNFGKAHLEGFGGVEGVIKGKSELYDFLRSNNKSVFVNEDDSIQIEKAKGIKKYSFSERSNTSDLKIQLIKTNPFVELSYNNTEIQSQLIGKYNFKNISAAITIGKFFNVEDRDIKNAIENYSPTNNRSQIIIKNSNRIILDAYNANPTSMEASIKSLESLKADHKIVFLGDMFELGKDSQKEHQAIIDLLCKTSFNEIYVVGEDFNKTKSTVNKILRFEHFNDLEKILKTKSIENSTLLIKGSRGMKMERILDILE